MKYPQRPQFYAIKYLQWLIDSCLSAEVGTDGFTFLSVIVLQEDRQRYQRHVNFWTSQLCEKLNVSRQTLVTVRNRLVRAGLLAYQPGARQRPARYFTTGMELDTVQNLDTIQSQSNHNLITSYPTPTPTPISNSGDPKGITKKTIGKQDKKSVSKSDTNLPGFQELWESYPSRNGRKLERKKAIEQFKKLKLDDMPKIMLAVRAYSQSGTIPKDLFRWLRDESWREWLQAPSTNGHTQHSPPKKAERGRSLLDD